MKSESYSFVFESFCMLLVKGSFVSKTVDGGLVIFIVFEFIED